jgi:hypothetical protein
MSKKKYYCYCESNCRYETMTKEQILAAIAQAAAGGLVFDTEAAIISKVKEVNAGGFVTFWVGKQAEYNALPSIDPNCVYIITDNTWQGDVETLFRNHIDSKGNPHGLTIEMIGAASATELTKHVQNKANPHGVTCEQIGAAPAYTKGTTDLKAGVSALASNTLHFVYVKG